MAVGRLPYRPRPYYKILDQVRVSFCPTVESYVSGRTQSRSQKLTRKVKKGTWRNSYSLTSDVRHQVLPDFPHALTNIISTTDILELGT